MSRLDKSIGAVEPEAAETYVTEAAVALKGENAPAFATEAASQNGGRVLMLEGKAYTLREDIRSVLIIGIDDMDAGDTEASPETAHADFLVLAVLDESGSTVRLLQLDRDTITAIPVPDAAENRSGPLLTAHTFGDDEKQRCENTVSAVSNLLCGLPIDDYICVTMGAVPIVNDMLGGVTVTVTDSFAGIDDTLQPGQETTLTGQQALTYVRSCFDMPENKTNENRMARHRVYTDAAIGQLRDAVEEDDTVVEKLLLAISDHLVSDLTIKDLISYLEAAADYEYLGFVTPEGEWNRTEGYEEFYPDQDALESLVIELFCQPAELE